jgi:hypothetical protein
MVARKVLTGIAVLTLGGGVLASVANAAPVCGSKACSDEAAASGLTGSAGRACLKSLNSDCQAGVCSCTGGSPPCSCVCGDGLCGPSEDCGTCPQDCGTCTIQCCVPGSPMGAFACVLETASDCSIAGGVNRGLGTCDPNACCGFNGAPCCGGTTCFTGLGCSGGFCTLCPSTTTTTTLPMCTVGAAFCPSFNPVCLNGHTCVVDGGTGLCDCTGPTPTCGQWGIIACGGTCPAGDQCALENIAPPGCQQVPVCHCVPAP